MRSNPESIKGKGNKRILTYNLGNLLVGSILGDSLGSLGHGVLGELSRKKKSGGSLDLTGADSDLLVVASEP